METKHGGTILVAFAILAIVIALISNKNQELIINLAFPALVAGLFINFVN